MKKKDALAITRVSVPWIAISDVVEINDVRLLNITAEAPQHHDGSPLNVQCSVNDVSTSRTDDGKAIIVKAAFEVTGRQGESAAAKPILKIAAIFLAIYSLPAECIFKPEALDAFGKTNGVFNIWPYWRELLQSITTRMGLPPLTLSVFRIPSDQRDVRRLQKIQENPPPENQKSK